MNKRIQELAEQCYEYSSTQIDVEKFAELIVKECAAVIINDSRLNDVRSAANGCVRIINEHFGVK